MVVAFALLFASAAAAADAGTGGPYADAVEIVPGTARPGDAVMVTFKGARTCPSAWLGTRALTFFSLADGCRAFAALPVELEPGELPLLAAPPGAPDGGAPEVVGTLEVRPPNFNVRELTVANKFVEPPASVKRRMAEDRKAFERAFAQKWAPPKFEANFVWPVDNVITAPFGDLRTFNGKKQSQHYGTDIDGRIGDPVHAANDGVVVMARDNYAAGRTVVLHHGADLYTTYFHLSKIEVAAGQKVKKGQRIGRVGKTGRVTGPHLHFGIKIGGLYVDPVSVLKLDLSR